MPSGQSAPRPPQAAPLPVTAEPSAPTKRDLASWWKQFKKNNNNNTTKEDKKVEPPQLTGIFGVPLQTSIKYANVAISLFDAEGHSFIYGYVPIVVAKCGVFLKEKATDVEGIFRLAGAERRIKELQALFNSPERYGKGLDWTGYTVHDAANILRRYLNQLPEPIIPLNFYQRFREPLRHHQAQAVGAMDHQGNDVGGFDENEAIRTYQQLITELPPLNRQLLLYILDLLAVFASKSDLNKMPATNLSAIFQPGLLSHPDHDLSPAEYRLSQDVLIFLIDKQDHFLVGMQGTAIDQKTKLEVQSGAPSPGTPKNRSQPVLGRSASNASAGADSLRRYGGVRRNVSTSSKHSRQSNNTPSPVTPPTSSPFTGTPKGGGVHRSNTVPSKRSPSIGTERYSRDKPSDPVPTAAVAAAAAAAADAISAGGATATVADRDVNGKEEEVTAVVQGGNLQEITKTVEPLPQKSPLLSPTSAEQARASSRDRSPIGTPLRERGFSSFFRGPTEEKGETRRPNKLQKRRPEGLSAQSSNHSLSGTSHPPSPSAPPQLPQTQPMAPYLDGDQSIASFKTASPDVDEEPSENQDSINPNTVVTEPPAMNLDERLSTDRTIGPTDSEVKTEVQDNPPRASASTTLKADRSPSRSHNSSIGNEGSSLEHVDGVENSDEKKERRHRWNFSRSGAKSKNEGTASSSRLGSVSAAERSTSSVGSAGKPRKSYTDDSNPSNAPPSSSEAEAGLTGSSPEKKRGPLGWFKGKLEERKEKDRAKSPPPAPIEESVPPQVSLDAFVTGDETSNGTEKVAEPLMDPASEVTSEEK